MKLHPLLTARLFSIIGNYALTMKKVCGQSLGFQGRSHRSCHFISSSINISEYQFFAFDPLVVI